MKHLWISLIAIVLSVSCTSQDKADSIPVKETTESVDTLTITASNKHDKTAHHLSGTAFYYDDDSTSISETEWNNYAITINNNWDMIEEKRLQPMQK
ncbi:MAG: hypothetical protein U9N51_05910 [Bacteroidota bacterium]|nr:hypothetical protein [Bacteroidota bacterium]